ncbi:MAG: glycosyltransferase family 2 protein, partial [Arenicellales bacterium]
MRDGNLVLPAASDGVLSPPLVSLVLINWNCASFVGAAIRSIRGQDYPWFEAIVVDNGSTDESREVIARHVTGDSRFRVIHLERNFGQLGAFLDVFGELRGDFVTIIDADDVLFCNFLSSHIQVHLALPFSVAFTSSNVVEMTAAGRVITGGYVSFKGALSPDSFGLRRPDAAVRLTTISDIDYLRLSDATRTFVHVNVWIWGPGTSNMFRRSVLTLVHFKPKDRTYFRAADNYLCPFCHALAGSALINKPLSAYRIHDNNYFTERESMRNVSKGRSEIAGRSKREALETLGILFARAEFFQEVLPGKRFW